MTDVSTDANVQDWRKLYPFAPHYTTTAGGHRLHYVDEGKGPAVVMVHGNPTWSFYYRNVIQELSGSHRCIVPDHIGCGLSEKPQDWSYRLEDHIENLERLIDEVLELEQIDLVMHDWGGAIGMGYAVRHPEKVRRLVILNTGAFHGHPCPWRIRVCRIPGFGAVAVRGFNAFAGSAVHMAVTKPLAKAVRDGFLFPYNSWANRIATLRFVEDIPLAVRHPSWQTLGTIQKNLHDLRSKPTMICWGEKDFCFTTDFLKTWRSYFPDAEVHSYPEAGHYILEDARDTVIPLIGKFLQ